MKQNNKKKKRALLRRRIRRIGYTLAVVICLICIGLITYIFLLEEGIVKLNSKSQPERKVVTSQSNVQTMQVLSDESPITEEYQQQDNRIVDTSNTTIVPETVEVVNSQISNLSESKVVKQIGNVDPANISIVEDELFLLPDGLLEYFITDGWEIYVTDEDIAEVYFNGKYKSVMEATIYSKKWIVIENREEAVLSSPLHAFGHYLDYINGSPVYSEADLPSSSDEFKAITDEEMEIFKSNIPNSSCVRNTQEFYAETFYYYLTCPSKCTPEAFEFMKSQIEIFQERCSL